MRANILSVKEGNYCSWIFLQMLRNLFCSVDFLYILKSWAIDFSYIIRLNC